MVATEIIIEEVTGPSRRTVVLRGRSMPDTNQSRPVIGATQARGRVNYPPGNSQADIALSAAMWLPTELRGGWNDKYLWDDRNAPTLIGFSGIAGVPRLPTNARDPSTASSATPGLAGRARTAFQVVQAFQLLNRGLQTLRFEWGPVALYGILREFQPAYKTLEDVEWTARFEWTSDTIVPPKPKTRSRVEAGGLIALFKRLLDLLKSIFDLVGLPARIFQGLITGPWLALSAAVEELLQSLTKVLTGALAPLNVLDDLRAGLNRIKSAALDLAGAVTAALAQFKEPLSPRAAAEADLAILRLSKEALRMAAVAAEREAELAAMQTPELIAAVVSTAGQDLRGIAVTYYGDVAEWIRLATYNGFASSTIPDGTLVLVPAKQ